MTEPMTAPAADRATDRTTVEPVRPGRRAAARPTRRRMLAAVGAGAAATLLAACGEQPRARSGHVVATDDLGLILPDLAEREDMDSHALELPGCRFRVGASSIQPTLTRSRAEALGFLEAAADGEDTDPDEEVLAPEGEVFLLAELRTENPVVFSRELPTPGLHSDRLVIGGEAGEPWPQPVELGSTVRVALTVPEDPGPEDAMFELTCEDVVQRLSLVDGSRVSSDLEHWYRHWYRAVPEQVWWERFDDAGEAGLVMAGAVHAVHVQPGLGDGTWPGPGEILLGISLATLESPEGVTPRYDLALVLPDGTEATRRGRTADEALEDPDHPQDVWFEVPHDVETVTARLTLGMRTADGEEISLGTEETPVQILPMPR